MFLAAIIQNHVDAESEPKEAATDESPTTLDADATWPSFKPRVAPDHFGRTAGASPGSRARWT